MFADADALAQGCAEDFAQAASRAIGARGTFAVALAGGSTPRATYALLASPRLRDRVDWNAVRFFFGDERCVPPTDPASNFGMARDTLFTPLGIDAAHVFRMRGEDVPADAAATYAATLTAELGPEPVFDLVMLGMGPEGHTASLFPGSHPSESDSALVEAPFVAKFNTYRITVTPRVINAAREVAIATHGAEKADALAHALDGPYDPNLYPVQIVNPVDGQLIWFVDQAALQQS